MRRKGWTTIFGTKARPCSRHGWEDVGALTGECLVCHREVGEKLMRNALRELGQIHDRRVTA